jgi:hypothetical protein
MWHAPREGGDRCRYLWRGGVVRRGGVLAQRLLADQQRGLAPTTPLPRSCEATLSQYASSLN